MRTAFTILTLTLGLALCAEAKPKKDKNKGGNDVENFIENVTGVDLNSKKGKGHNQLNNAINQLTGSNHGKKNRNNNSLDPLSAIQQYIFGYQRDHKTRNLPPGLQKKVNNGGSLPPGWQKKLYRGNIFPHDLWGYTSPLNYNQVPRFGPPGNGIDYYSIGNRLLKLNRSDNRILDVMDF